MPNRSLAQEIRGFGKRFTSAKMQDREADCFKAKGGPELRAKADPRASEDRIMDLFIIRMQEACRVEACSKEKP